MTTTSMQKEYDLQYFHTNGYTRKKCKACRDYFWTLDSDAIYCGDQPCVPFSFIGKPIAKKPLHLSDVREGFLSFFDTHGHSRLHYPETGQRCPVIARWRSDIYLTIASIADFQPHVTSGAVPPPANPLVISQPCIRLNDLDQVGHSGRHLTIFEMMGHHAFNKNINEIYWKDETVAYCDEFFRTKIGIPREAINYKEQLWIGGGNAGPCVEVLAGGLEIATLVFMNMKEDDQGKTVIEQKHYAPNPLNIVDTGYGLERIAWFTTGTPTVYETVFPKMITFIQDNARDTSDKASIYALADHTKCLSFMLGDGIVPSNVKAGYLARLIIRRSLRFIEALKLPVSLTELVHYQLELLSRDFPAFQEHTAQIEEILTIETNRYTETLSRGQNLVKRLLADKGTIDTKELIHLYDTHGMQPTIVQRIAAEQGTTITIPENFDSMIAELHSHAQKETEEETTRSNLPSTTKLYYQDHYTKAFNATVLWTHKTKNGTEVILDKTAFYPEGGGQLGDMGSLSCNGTTYPVKRTIKEADAIIHLIDGTLNINDHVHGTIDWDHRYTLMKHHTGTHVVNGALRHLFGEHIWQAGSQLGLTEARFDFAHYKPITDDELHEIERLANHYITQALPVEKPVLDRNTAERTYGFRLYQGGVPPGNTIRVIHVPGLDVEACGGTHLNNIKEIEKIKIIKTERIQDGVNRIIFAAGAQVDTYHQEETTLYTTLLAQLKPLYTITDHANVSHQLKEAAKIFSVSPDQLEKTIQRFITETDHPKKITVATLPDACQQLFNQWKTTQKQKKTISSDDITTLIETTPSLPRTTIKIITLITDSDAIALAGLLIQHPNIIAHIYDGKKLVSAASDNLTIDLRTIAPEIGKILGGSGGGKPHLTQCGGPHKDKVPDALEKAKHLTIKRLQKT
jgi:alanyl-tRNA synthetase